MKKYFECKIDDATTLLRVLRNDEKMNQRDVAKIAGTSHAVICAFECNRREPTLDWVKRVAGAMGYEVRFVLTKKITG
jgi:transcriptional regulator with XRE-family HTH domain